MGLDREERSRKLLLYTGRRTALNPELDDALNGVSRRLFGLVRAETEYDPPPYYWDLGGDDPERWRIDGLIDEFERQLKAAHLPEPEALQHLQALGVSFHGPMGEALHGLRHFDRQAELAALGLKGSLPEPVEVNHDALSTKLEDEARRWKTTRSRA